MAKHFARWFARDGWFTVVPPEKINADFRFKSLFMAGQFCAACGWILKRG